MHYHPFAETLAQIVNDWKVTGGNESNEFNFILAGQSNSVGRIETIDPTFPADLPSDGAIPNANYFRSSDNSWQPFTTFMNYSTDHSGDASVEYRVAKHFTDKGKTVNLLKYGEGGQAVSGGCWADDAGCTLGLIDAVKLSGKEFTHLIWIQGESDAVTQPQADAYEVEARLTLEKLRRETGQNFKLIICRIALPPETTGMPYTATVNTALQNLGLNMPNAAFVNIANVDNNTDIAYNQHYNGLGLDKMANDIVSCIEGNCPFIPSLDFSNPLNSQYINIL